MRSACSTIFCRRLLNLSVLRSQPRSSPKSMCAAVPRTPMRGWLSSWAMPAAISPRERSRSERACSTRWASNSSSARFKA